MNPHWLPDVDADQATPAPAIAAEIAERLLEWKSERSGCEVGKWLCQLVSIYNASPAAAWIYLEYQTGNMDRIGRSMRERGDDTARSHVAALKEREHALRVLRGQHPRLADELRYLYEATAPEAAADRYTQRHENT